MNSRKYEAFYIIRPDLKDSEINAILTRFTKIVTDQGGTVAKAEKWDKRKLAYEIKGAKEGNYIIMNFESGPNVPAELNRLMRISDDILRHTIVKDDGREANVIEPVETAAV